MISLSSLPRICVPLGVADVSKLERLAVAACDDGEDFLEVRLDMLDEPQAGIRVFRRIARRYPNVVLLATCRRKPNGGEFRGSIEAEIAILEDAARAGAGIVDVEIETAEEAPSLLAVFDGLTRLLISYHNFEKTPALSRVMRRLQKIPADLYKVAVFARKPSDALRTLDLAGSGLDHPIVSLAMGDVGVTTRILGPSRGAAFVFGSLAPKPVGRSRKLTAEPTAPGQISADESKMRLAKSTALIVGNGGAARAAVFALRDKGVEVTLTGRNPSRVRRLARDCDVASVDRDQLADRGFDILVQSTPLGMSPNVDDCFFEDRIPADVVFDMVYNPLETKLLRSARQQGKTTISGLEMFLEQAAAQFELWTGESAPRGPMRSAVLDRLAPSHAA